MDVGAYEKAQTLCVSGGKKVTSCVMRESKQKCGNFTAIAGNLEGLQLARDTLLHFVSSCSEILTPVEFF